MIDEQDFWMEQQQREQTEQAWEAEHPLTLNEQRDRLVNLCNALQHGSRAHRDAKAALAALDAKIDHAAESEWTRETTVERREAFNAAVQGATRGGRYNPQGSILVGLIERDLGFTRNELRRHVERHGL